LSLFWIVYGDTSCAYCILWCTESCCHSYKDEKLSNIDGKLGSSTRYNRETYSEFSIECVGIQSIRWVEWKDNIPRSCSVVISYNRSSCSTLHDDGMKYSSTSFHDGRGCCWDICSSASSFCQETIICNILTSYSGTKRVEKISICISLEWSSLSFCTSCGSSVIHCPSDKPWDLRDECCWCCGSWTWYSLEWVVRWNRFELRSRMSSQCYFTSYNCYLQASSWISINIRHKYYY